MPSSERIVDANLNRFREGLRVLEDIFRYLFDNQIASLRFKELRHKIRIKNQSKLLEARNTQTDCLKQTTQSEASRENITSVIAANFKRTQESARVLEEILKIMDTKEAEKFKLIRYSLYQIEAELATINSNSK